MLAFSAVCGCWSWDVWGQRGARWLLGWIVLTDFVCWREPKCQQRLWWVYLDAEEAKMWSSVDVCWLLAMRVYSTITSQLWQQWESNEIALTSSQMQPPSWRWDRQTTKRQTDKVNTYWSSTWILADADVNVVGQQVSSAGWNSQQKRTEKEIQTSWLTARWKEWRGGGETGALGMPGSMCWVRCVLMRKVKKRRGGERGGEETRWSECGLRL